MYWLLKQTLLWPLNNNVILHKLINLSELSFTHFVKWNNNYTHTGVVVTLCSWGEHNKWLGWNESGIQMNCYWDLCRDSESSLQNNIKVRPSWKVLEHHKSNHGTHPRTLKYHPYSFLPYCSLIQHFPMGWPNMIDV